MHVKHYLMKPTNDFLKRTILTWFNVSCALFVCLSFLVLFSCQKDEENLLNQKSINGINMTPFSASSCKTSVLYYGHQIFRRVHGKPFVETQKIENPDFELFNDNFVLMILNGDNKKTRVSSAEIRIDGKLIVGPRAFSKSVSFIRKKLHGLTPESILEVKLNGTPGSFIDLWIEGTLKEEMTVSDVEGNVYKTVTIGNQVWMAENLKTTKYNDGTNITMAAGNLPTTEAYFYYDNDISNKDIYGALYNWYAVNTAKLCPTGWHVPNNAEWQTLTDYLGGFYVAGGKMKEEGYNHWLAPNTGATNESGFTALPGGWAIHAYMGESAYFSSSSEYETNNSWSYYLNLFYNSSAGGIGGATFKEYGYSVRCLKNN
jgi:uncharacterized protein (TIGR02145 family)